MPLCCVGSACTATSTVSEDDVTSCEQTIMGEGCNAVSITIGSNGLPHLDVTS